MKNQTTRRFLCAAVTLLMILTLSAPAAAAYSVQTTAGMTKVAYINNINQDGSNIGTDITNPQSITDAHSIEFTLTPASLQISGSVEQEAFSVVGTIATTNENRNLLLYTAEDSTGNHEVAYISVERQLNETALFFRQFYTQNPSYVNVIKLYMQPVDSNALVYIEIFITSDFVASHLAANNVTYDSNQANTLQSWFAKYYHPIPKEPAVAPLAFDGDDVKIRDFSETYTINGTEVTFRFVVNLRALTDDLHVNESKSSRCTVYIEESRTISSLAANNSSTQNCLSLESINIQFASDAGLPLTSLESLRGGLVNAYGVNADGISIAYGIGAGPLSLAGSFTFVPHYKDDEKTEVYTLGKDDAKDLPYHENNYTMSAQTGVLPNGYALKYAGSSYGFVVNFTDDGETVRIATPQVNFLFRVCNSMYYADSYDYGEIVGILLFVKE